MMQRNIRFEDAVRVVAAFGRVDRGPEVAVGYFRPIASFGYSPGEALARIGLELPPGAPPATWERAIFRLADCWWEIDLPPPPLTDEKRRPRGT
jgi:hypothetical protein